jgi:hypothetical protein
VTTHLTGSHYVLPTGFAEAALVDKHLFLIEVRRHRAHRLPTDLFEVWNVGSLLDRDGVWRDEYDKRDEPEAFLFPEDEALARAHAAADDVMVNGLTLAQWEARNARLRAEDEAIAPGEG